MSDHWLEINSPTRETSAAVYAAADAAKAASIHHFFEPWFEDGVVIRVMGKPSQLKKIAEAARAAGADPHDWDATPDEILYGDQWPAVRDFFEAASRLCLPPYGMVDGQWLDRKLVHCALNSWGYDVPEERDFASNFAKERKKMLKIMRKEAKK